jgi:hypothetical protein
MTPEETIRLAAVDVRERPEEDTICTHCCAARVEGKDFCMSCGQPFDLPVSSDTLCRCIIQRNARISQLEQERDEAVAWVHTITSAGLYDGDALDAFLAKHPQPAKEQVE